jgi:hypothetical protein
MSLVTLSSLKGCTITSVIKLQHLNVEGTHFNCSTSLGSNDMLSYLGGEENGDVGDIPITIFFFCLYFL